MANLKALSAVLIGVLSGNCQLQVLAQCELIESSCRRCALRICTVYVHTQTGTPRTVSTTYIALYYIPEHGTEQALSVCGWTKREVSHLDYDLDREFWDISLPFRSDHKIYTQHTETHLPMVHRGDDSSTKSDQFYRSTRGIFPLNGRAILSLVLASHVHECGKQVSFVD